MISRCFDKVITVSATIPKLETILFPELKDAGYLFPISRFEDTVIIHIINTYNNIHLYYNKKTLTRECRTFDELISN